MIPSPNLDDRTYQEIVDEAIRLIPHYCPEWTNHNPSDPGIVMIELFSWMMEMVIYRLNRVPDKVYLTLLDLIGLSFNPPQSARALLKFFPVEKYEGEVTVKKGTQISTTKTELDEYITFETEKDLVVSNISLAACFSSEQGRITDNLLVLNNEESREAFSLFSGHEEIERYMYVCDPTIGFLAEDNIINVVIGNANEIKTTTDEIVNFMEWEYWDGKKWTSLEYSRSVPGMRKKDNELYFTGPVEISEHSVNGVEGFFLRSSLIDIPDRPQCFEINDVSVRLLFRGEGLSPDECICNTDNMVYYPIDLNKDFTPFVDIPKYNDSFYIASADVFSKEDAEISIDVYLSDAEGIDKPEPKDDLILKFEYWNGRNWMELGTSTIDGVPKPAGRHNFVDKTNALTKSGEIKFLRPANMKESKVNGKSNYWVRIRIGAGDFGSGGQYQVDDEGKWVWIFDKPVRPPVLSRLRLRYLAENRPVSNVMSYYDFSYFDFSKKNINNYWLAREEDENTEVPFYKIFQINKEKCPITYLGFSRKFPRKNFGIYFRIDERNRIKPERTRVANPLGIKITQAARQITLHWEYWDGNDWNQLSVNDYTDSFHKSGFVEFVPPTDLKSKSEFGKDLYWVRVVLASGSFEKDPRILAIDLNAVYAGNMRSVRNELMGSSSGQPSQEFTFLHGPVLPDMEIIVREGEVPPANEREVIFREEGDDAIQMKQGIDGGDEVWVRYHKVDNFYSSTSLSRHYVLDYLNNKIIFGNGKSGVIPSKGKNNIKAASYRTGGSTRGNVGSNTICLLKESIPYIAEVNNPYPAEGGANLEDLDSLKSRATNIFKNLNRAVTSEDYEWLAKEASFSVARARCLSKTGRGGEVIVKVLPRPDSDDFDLRQELYPTSELLRRVKEFLDARKLVGTKLRVEGPVYIHIIINLRIAFKGDVSEVQILRDRVELAVRRFLHPVIGGSDGNGWPFGQPLSRNEIFRVLEKIDGIYYVEDIEIVKADSKIPVDKLSLEEENLIHVSGVNIDERKVGF